MNNLQRKLAIAGTAMLLTCSVVPVPAQADELDKVVKKVVHYMEHHERIVRDVDKALYEAAKLGDIALKKFCGSDLSRCAEDVIEIAIEAGDMDAKTK